MLIGFLFLSLWYMITVENAVGDTIGKTEIVLPDTLLTVLANDSCDTQMDRFNLNYHEIYRIGRGLNEGEKKVIVKERKKIVISRIKERIIDTKKKNLVELTAYTNDGKAKDNERFVLSLGSFEIMDTGDTARVVVPIGMMEFLMDFFNILTEDEEDKEGIKIMNDIIEALKSVEGSFRLLHSRDSDGVVEIYIR